MFCHKACGLPVRFSSVCLLRQQNGISLTPPTLSIYLFQPGYILLSHWPKAASLLTNGNKTYSQHASPPTSWPLPDQSRRCSHRLAHRTVWWRQALSWDSLFPNMPKSVSGWQHLPARYEFLSLLSWELQEFRGPGLPFPPSSEEISRGCFLPSLCAPKGSQSFRYVPMVAPVVWSPYLAFCNWPLYSFRSVWGGGVQGPAIGA